MNTLKISGKSGKPSYADMIEKGGDKLYGLFDGSIVSYNQENGQCQVFIDRFDNEVTAEISNLTGGDNSSVGFTSPPVPGARCFVMFRDGMRRAAVVIGFSRGTQAGDLQYKPGDMSLKTPGNQALLLDAENDSISIKNAKEYGIQADTSKFTLSHKSFEIKSREDYTNIWIFRNKARISYTNNALGIDAPNYYLKVEGKHEAEYASKKEIVRGNYVIKSDNNIKISTNSMNVSSMSTINMSSVNRLGFMTGDYSLVANKNIINVSNFKNIYHVSNAGTITLAAGTVATEQILNTAGVALASARIDISQIGLIELSNLLATTTYNPGGIIEETAITRTNNYATTYTENALTYTMNNTTNTINTTTHNVNAIAANFSVGGVINLTSGGTLSIVGPVMNISTVAPVGGVATITIFGPQPLLPF